MRECSVLQYSVHSTVYVPGCVASNHAIVVRPGTASCLMRNSGTKKLWMTSRDVRISRTGRFAGTYRSEIDDVPFGYANVHIHCLATTYTSIAFAGGFCSRTNCRNPM